MIAGRREGPEPVRDTGLPDVPQIVAVVAMAENRVIGRNGGMPWRLPSDLRRYRALTMGKPMIMGRRTLEAIGRVLDGRDTIVLTRQKDFAFDGAYVAHDPQEALAIAGRRARERGTDEIAVVGGGHVYDALLDRTDRLYVTHVEAAPEGDAWFPEIDPRVWVKISEEPVERSEKDSAACRFAIYDRR